MTFRPPNPLTPRELGWLRHIAVHGPQSSKFLVAQCADTHRCKDTGLRTLQKLRETGFLREPSQQKQIANADFNPKVYDLTRQAELHLRGLRDPDTVRPTGHWWHAFLTASITSAIEITAKAHGTTYIPAHTILARSNATLAIPTGHQRLIPDQLFALNYGGKFRSFVLEVDRGTEPKRSNAARKSLKSMIARYRDLTAKDALRAHYGLKSPLFVLMAFTQPQRAASALELVEEISPAIAPFVLAAVVPGGFPRVVELRDAVSKEWPRAGLEPMSIFE